MVLQIILPASRVYLPWVLLPFTMTIGFIGYTIEWKIRRNKITEAPKSIFEQREERRLRELKD